MERREIRNGAIGRRRRHHTYAPALSPCFTALWMRCSYCSCWAADRINDGLVVASVGLCAFIAGCVPVCGEIRLVVPPHLSIAWHGITSSVAKRNHRMRRHRVRRRASDWGGGVSGRGEQKKTKERKNEPYITHFRRIMGIEIRIPEKRCPRTDTLTQNQE